MTWPEAFFYTGLTFCVCITVMVLMGMIFLREQEKK